MPCTARLHGTTHGGLLRGRPQANHRPVRQKWQDGSTRHLASLRALFPASALLDTAVTPHSIEQRLLSMPPVRALQLRLHDHDHDSLRLAAPLTPNINDKGNAFGGSLASVMTLAAWALMSMRLEDAGYRADVYVQDSTLRYIAPLYDDLIAEARLVPGQDWNSVIGTFAQRGKARAQLAARILDSRGTLCCTLEGRFVALTPKPAG